MRSTARDAIETRRAFRELIQSDQNPESPSPKLVFSNIGKYFHAIDFFTQSINLALPSGV